MNTQFNEEQIRAYASAFRVGDAIYCNGEWHQVVEIECDKEEGWTARLAAYVDDNNKIISFGTGRGVVLDGFLHDLVTNPYRVTTLADYELKGGEKLVWLGIEKSTVAQRTFGKVYDVIHDYSDGVFYRDDNETCYEIKSSNWGVIPTYKQVVLQETQPQQEDPSLTILEQRLSELRKEHNELQKDILEKQNYERKLAEVVINLEEVIDSLKKLRKE